MCRATESTHGDLYGCWTEGLLSPATRHSRFELASLRYRVSPLRQLPHVSMLRSTIQNRVRHVGLCRSRTTHSASSSAVMFWKPAQDFKVVRSLSLPNGSPRWKSASS